MESEYYSCYQVNVSVDSVNETAWSYTGLPNPQHYRQNGIVLASFLTLFLLVGTALNLLVMATIFKKHLHTQPTFILLLNLAVTDFLLCLLVMPFHIIAGFAGEFIFGNTDDIRCQVCKTGAILTILVSQSLFSLSLISVDRLLFIKRPLRYHKIVTWRWICAAVVVIWGVSIAISLPPLFGMGQINYSYTLSHCIVDPHINSSYIIMLVLVALIPLTILTICTMWVACIAQRHLRAVYKTTLSLSSPLEKKKFTDSIYKRVKRKKSRLQFHLVRVFGAIIIANIVTWLPMLCWICAGIALPSREDIPLPFKTVAFLTFLIQPVVHPLLEASLISDLKPQLSRLVGGVAGGVAACVRCEVCGRGRGEVSPTSPPVAAKVTSAGDERRGRVQCDCGVVVNGVRVGRVGGAWTCSICGILDMCSILILPPADDPVTEIPSPSTTNISHV